MNASPSGVPTLRADARRNREALLEAADQAFAEEGINVPVDEIARRAGVGAGTLYRHFPTKEKLFEAVLVSHLDSIVERSRALVDSTDPAGALLEFMTCLAGEAARKRTLIDALAGAGVDIHEAASDSKLAIEEAFRQLVGRAQASGAIRTDVTVADLFGLLMGTCSVSGPGVADADQARMLRVVFDGLRVSSAT
jgi:AcrR family transcriptional regulator